MRHCALLPEEDREVAPLPAPTVAPKAAPKAAVKVRARIAPAPRARPPPRPIWPSKAAKVPRATPARLVRCTTICKEFHANGRCKKCSCMVRNDNPHRPPRPDRVFKHAACAEGACVLRGTGWVKCKTCGRKQYAPVFRVKQCAKRCRYSSGGRCVVCARKDPKRR